MNKVSFLVSSTNKVHISTEDGWTWCAYHLKSYRRLDTFGDVLNVNVVICKFCFDWFNHFAKFADSLTKRAPNLKQAARKSGKSTKPTRH